MQLLADNQSESNGEKKKNTEKNKPELSPESNDIILLNKSKLIITIFKLNNLF